LRVEGRTSPPDPARAIREFFVDIDRNPFEKEASAPTTTDLERARRRRAQTLLAFLRKVDAQDRRVARAKERLDDCLRSYRFSASLAKTPFPSEDIDFMRSGALKLLETLTKEIANFGAMPKKYLQLISKVNRQIGAAKARAATSRMDARHRPK
jgi:hypothetical protein